MIEMNDKNEYEMRPYGYPLESGFNIVNVTSVLELDMFCGDGHSFFYADETGSKGNLWFWAILYDANGQVGAGAYDEFEWGWEENGEANDLVGTYTATCKGYDYFGEEYTKQDVNRTDEVLVRQIDDTHTSSSSTSTVGTMRTSVRSTSFQEPSPSSRLHGAPITPSLPPTRRRSQSLPITTMISTSPSKLHRMVWWQCVHLYQLRHET